eukprot:99749-Amphidinium_carterae.1
MGQARANIDDKPTNNLAKERAQERNPLKGNKHVKKGNGQRASKHQNRRPRHLGQKQPETADVKRQQHS